MNSGYETRSPSVDTNSPGALVVDLIGYDKQILHVGSDTGNLAQILADRGVRVTEISPGTAERSTKHRERIVVGDVESLDLDGELGEELFDVIVFGDTLEGLRDPLQTLRRLKPFLRPEGYVVASVPNAAHGGTRLALLQGKVRYQDLGLPDGAQRRFFTRESIEQLFKAAGFLITELRRAMRGIFDAEIGIDRGSIPDEVLRLVQEGPESLTYRFVLAAHPSGEPGMLAKSVRLLSDQLARRDRTIYELSRKLRNFEDLQGMLDRRTEELAERELEAARLAEEVAERNDRLARLVQFGKEEA